MNEEQLKKIEKIADFMDKSDISANLPLVEELQRMNELLEKIAEKEMPKMEMPEKMMMEMPGVEMVTLKGDKGDCPSKEELIDLITPLIPEPIVGPRGEKGDSIVGPMGPAGRDGESIVGPKGENGKDGSPDTADQIRDKLETLEDEARLRIEAINGLKEALEKLDKRIGARPIFGGGFNTSALNLHIIDDESPTDSGDHIHFTLAHTPSPVSSLKVYRGGARQRVTEDYTISGVNLTLNVALNTGEILLVDYRC